LEEHAEKYEAMQKQIIEHKQNERANSLKEAKRLRQSLGFAAGTHKDFWTNKRS